MKKRFLKVSFFCLLMACMPATFTSCKDYDDDIAVLTEQTGSLQSQLETLEKELNANKEAADQAAQAAADALKEAERLANAAKDKAVEEAALAAAEADAKLAESLKSYADQAAATAKAEAIAEVMEEIKTLLDEQHALAQEELDKIAGKIEGIEKELNKLSGVPDEVEKLKEAIALQEKTFEEFQKLINGKIETLETNYANLLETVEGLEKTMQDADDAIKADIADVKASVQANATAIAEINTRIDEIETELDALDKKIDDVKNQAFGYTDAEVAELKAELMGVMKEMEDRLGGQISTLASNLANALNTLSTVFTDRLTSITLMPDAYVDGIPCIDFTTATFQEMTQGATADDWYVADGAKTMYITPDVLPINYRLSPKSVRTETIESVAFVEKTATILTRGAEDDCILEVAGFKVENGVLVVNAAKNRKAAINKTEDGKINIAALRVNQKATNENGVTIEGAEVHSEYARVTEGYYTPTLAAIAEPENHLWTKTEVAGTQFASVVYDAEEKLDLNNLISVCRVLNDKHSIIEDLSSYNLTIDFALAEMNTAVYSVIENGVITPGAMIDGAFVAAHPTAAYQSQIYRATLKHDDKVVDVKFVEVYFRPSEKVELTVNFEGTESLLSCTPEKDYTVTVKWADFFEEVMSHENILAANADEFNALYNEATIEFSGLVEGKTLDASIYNFASTVDASNPFVWQITFNENIPAEVFPIPVGGERTLDVTITVTPKDANNYPKVIAKTILTIKFPESFRSEMAPQIETYWKDKSTLRVLPLQYGSLEAGVTCDYRFPLQQAFLTNNTQSVVFNKSISCVNWDVVYSDTQSAGYAVSDYSLYFNGVEGSQLEWEAENDDHARFDELCNVADNHLVYATVYENAAGRELIDANQPVQITFFAKYPNGQVVAVQSYNMQFVKPLNFDTAQFNGSFKDGLLPGQEGSVINTADQFVIEDFRGNIVKKNAGDGLYNYYAIQPYEWHVDEARIGIMQDGTITPKDKVAYTITEGREKGMVRANEQYTMLLSEVPNADLAVKVEGDNLIYVNEGGLNTEKEYYLVVPVTVAHKWGKAETAVVIPVQPGKIVNNAPRK